MMQRRRGKSGKRGMRGVSETDRKQSYCEKTNERCIEHLSINNTRKERIVMRCSMVWILWMGEGEVSKSRTSRSIASIRSQKRA